MDLGSEITNQIKAAIKTKLEELGSYVDNELPEYIMVMLSNKRGKKQITDDLMLFLGENTVKFIDWLLNLVEKLKDVTSLVEAPQEEPKVILYQDDPVTLSQDDPVTLSQDDPVTLSQDHPVPEEEAKTEVKEQIASKSGSKDKRKSPSQLTNKENSQSKSSKSSNNNRSEKSKGNTSSNRRGSSEPKHTSRKRKLSESDDDDTAINPQMSSVVRVQEKRPSLPPSKQATTSLLKKAVAAAHMSVTKVIHSLTYDPTSPPTPITKAHSLEEKKQQKEILLQQHRELQKQIKTNELEQMTQPESENGHQEHTNKEGPEPEQKPEENTVNVTNEPVIELQVSEAEALEYSVEPVQSDTRIVAFADSQTATEPEEEHHKRRKKRAVKSRERARSPKFIVTLDGVDSELEDKFENHSKHKDKHKKIQSEFDDYVEIDPSNIPPSTQSELSPEKVEFVAPAVEQVMFRLDNTSDDEEMHQMSVVSRPQEKCRFWPDCMNGSKCPFYHPSTPCRTFPNCKFADKCLFVHPICKFDGRCTNTSCPFLHKTKTKPKPITAQVKPPPEPVLQVDESLPTLTTITPCKFFPGCTRSNCPFLHPKPNITKVCRYGSTCSRIDCKFNHPPSKAAMKWVAPSLHISERSFAIPEESVTKMPVAS